MKRIESIDLQGANAYFTNFDNRIVASSSNIEALERYIERSLKVLLLTKNNVVCAASHLVNPITYKLFSSNPILLKKEMVLPAFRKDKKEISELFEGKNINHKRKKEYISFYNDILSKTVLWELEENSTWFRDTFIKGLISKNSVVRSNLKYLSNSQIEKFILEIQNCKILDRNKIDILTLHFDTESRLILRNYRELVYHMSGARVVNCESTLPQENYIDYSFTDLENRKTQLSELQIFWKIYIELLLEMLNRYKFPIEGLDNLSFNDIYCLRQPILNSDFIENYNKFIHLSINSISKENRIDILYNTQELMKIRESLELQYKEIFESQLTSYFKKNFLHFSKETLKNSANIGLGFTPIPNIISGGLNFVNEIKAAYFNVHQSFTNLNAIKNYNHYIQGKEKILKNYINKFNIRKGTEMVDLIKLIQYTLSEKSTF
ncbi:hypothetical protein [Capnocytophaga canis]|uniref:Uncharacterized protein n=1 Tax=Capnocytophaga canis TaxID=1848903 RepID=A0A0B7IPH9_9FLAO|nr:hypothetical protein [Capnocytophaga canis]CEN53776.1 hypothetical protein CCAND93_560005 [Capnocytophaga canis]